MTQQTNAKKSEAKSSSSKKKDSNGQKLPKYCFLCSRSSRVGPLAECSYCFLYFHLDCLNPPLCSMPKDPWMCPNHADHLLEDHLLNEIEDEDLKLSINDLTNDENLVKLKFMNKIKSTKRLHDIYKHSHLKSSVKASIPIDSTIYGKVPSTIKQFYANAIKLKDVYKSIFELKDAKGASASCKDSSESASASCQDTTESDAEIWLSALTYLNDLSNTNESLKANATVEEASKSPEVTSINTGLILPAHNFCKQAIKPRAIIQCMNNDVEKKVFNVPYRIFRIGCSDSSDLNLRHLNIALKCKFVSDKHAEIYYDDYTSHFELLNYSEHGTLINQVLYANDISGAISGGDESDNGTQIAHTMSSRYYDTFNECKCQCSYTDLLKGQCWEGAAILGHGTHLKFGCFEFIFSIVDYNTL